MVRIPGAGEASRGQAGGPRAVKFGVTHQYVLALEAVLPTGELARLGARTLKSGSPALYVGPPGGGEIAQLTGMKGKYSTRRPQKGACFAYARICTRFLPASLRSA